MLLEEQGCSIPAHFEMRGWLIAPLDPSPMEANASSADVFWGVMLWVGSCECGCSFGIFLSLVKGALGM